MTNILFILFGIFVIVMSVTNAEWFFERSRAKFTVDIFGRQGARWVYGGTGVLIILMGLFLKPK
jgi:hypothetical protein